MVTLLLPKLEKLKMFVCDQLLTEKIQLICGNSNSALTVRML